MNNEKYSRPMMGETEILDKLRFDAPERMWKWSSVSDVATAIETRTVSTIQITTNARSVVIDTYQPIGKQIL